MEGPPSNVPLFVSVGTYNNEVRVDRLECWHLEASKAMPSALASLVSAACRPSLKLVECKLDGSTDGSLLFADEGAGVMPSLCTLMASEGNVLTAVRVGGNGPWPKSSSATLVKALSSENCAVEELNASGSGLDAGVLATASRKPAVCVL